MTPFITWLDAVFHFLPLPLLGVWGRFAFVVGLFLAVLAFGGFTLRPGGRWGWGREWQAWDGKAVISMPITFVAIVLTGYLGSFIVLVPGAQTFESLKDLVVFLCIVLFGYPALITVPFAYGLSDLIEGVPPGFLLDWLPGYFINPACFWVAYQFIGKNPDFRRARTWWMYLPFVVIFMSLEPVLWGYICADKFTPAISFGNITPALFFTTSITWLIAPFAMLAAFPLARRLGLFWAEIPGHVKERLLAGHAWVWESGAPGTSPGASARAHGWPIRMALLAPFIVLVLLMVGATAYVTLHSAAEDSRKLATRLHQEISDNIKLRLDEQLANTRGADSMKAHDIDRLLGELPVARDGIALIINRAGRVIASSGEAHRPVATRAVSQLSEAMRGDVPLQAGFEFQFGHITEKPLAREVWLARATAYQDRRGGHGDWIVLTLLPESFFLAGIQEGNSRSAMVFALALLLSLGVAAWLAALVTSPLRRISDVSEALAQGHLEQRAPLSEMEELNTLASSFNHMAERLNNSFSQLRELTGRLQTVRETESRRIALAVHDEVGQLLTGLKLDLRWIERGLEGRPDANLLLERTVSAIALVDESVVTVQRIASELRPAILDQLGLFAALRHESFQFSKRTGLACTFTGPDPEPELSAALATTCYRIAQEALTNVVRHAAASAVTIEFRQAGGKFILEIRDDGRGLTGRAAGDRAALGILGMRERARTHGGETTVTPGSAGGTVVRAEFPVESREGRP
jgi:two-component system sensor histidine kinase/response regulator